ncbi:MAG: hypothetical protein P4L35_02060 [Ignavibacteriaceae bacterium]|nr:hypothetical protein [Ignavibacteriaceae bacterium]
MQKFYLYIFGSISFLALIISGCVSLPSDVIMPQWDTDLNLPITTKNYKLSDIIKSQDYISINSQDSTYMISGDSLSQNVAISAFMVVNTETSTPSVSVIAGNPAPDTYLQFPEGAKLKNAEISKGIFKIVAHNTTTTDVQLTINFPGITKNGSPFPAQLTVPANTPSITQSYSFENCSYAQPIVQDPSYDGQLWLKPSASSSLGHPKISFESYTSDFNFTSITGYLPTKSLGTHGSSFSLSIGDATKYRDKVVLKTASLFLNGKFNSQSLTPFIVGINNLHLVGKRNDSQLADTLKFTNPESNSFRFDASGNYSTEYNESNSNITSFITFLPDSIYVSAEYVMNPDNNPDYKTVGINDNITFTTRFTSKSVLSIKQVTFVDTVDINMDQDNRDQIVKSQGAQLSVDIQNAIPLNTWIKVILTDMNYHPLLINGAPFAITKNNNGTDSVSIAGAVTDNNGNYSMYSSSSTTLSLDTLQIKQFAQNAQHAIISVTIETSHNNNIPVVVHASDWIKLNVFGKVSYRVKKN